MFYEDENPAPLAEEGDVETEEEVEEEEEGELE